MIILQIIKFVTSFFLFWMVCFLFYLNQSDRGFLCCWCFADLVYTVSLGDKELSTTARFTSVPNIPYQVKEALNEAEIFSRVILGLLHKLPHHLM